MCQRQPTSSLLNIKDTSCLKCSFAFKQIIGSKGTKTVDFCQS